MVLFGADRVEEYAHLFIGRTALLTGPSGRTSSNEPTFDALKRCCDLRLLLAPEHGIRGDKPAGAVFADEVDEDTGLTVRSLYTKESKRLSADTLALFDTLVYDVADVGCRYYTFLTSLRYCMEDCAAAGKRLVVLGSSQSSGRPGGGRSSAGGSCQLCGRLPDPGVLRPDLRRAGGDDERGAGLQMRPAHRPLRRSDPGYDLPGLGALLGDAQPEHPPLRNGAAVPRAPA